MTDLLQGEKKKPFGVPPAFLYGSFLLPLPCPAIAFGDGGTPSSLIILAMFPIWGDSCILCFFFGGLTASPEPPKPGTTRCDVTLARECQRLGASGCFSAKCSIAPPPFLGNEQSNLPPDFATIGGEQALFLYAVTFACPVVKIYNELLLMR